MHVGMSTGFANHRGINDGQFLQEEMKQILYGEELGYDSIWITEHHFSDYSIAPSPLQYLTWIAGKTRRMRLGTSVVVVPWHDPVRIAEEIAVLDHLSGGRAIIGFGRGLGRMEYEGFRVDQSKAREIFDEAVPLVLKALETGIIEGGKIFNIPRREIRPAPLRSLQGRAFCAAGTEASMIAAAKMGLGRLYLGQPNVSNNKDAKASFNPQAPAGLAEKQVVEMPLPNGTYAPDGPWDRAWQENHPGVPPTAPFVSNIIVVDESKERAEELCRRYSESNFHWIAKNYSLTQSYANLKGYESYQHLNMTQEQVDAAAKMAYVSAIYGDPKTVLGQMERSLRDLKPQAFSPTLYFGGMPHEECMRSLKLFAEKCMPELRSWRGSMSTIDDAPFLRSAA